MAGFAASFAICAAAAVAAAVLGLGKPPTGRAAWLTLLAAVAAWAVANFLIGDRTAGHLLGTAALVTLAFLLGRAVAERVERFGHLLPAAIVMAAADTWSVLAPAGVTQKVLERPELLPLLVLTFPYLGGDGSRVPLIGAMDIAVVVIFWHAARRFGLSDLRSAAATLAGFGITLAALLLLAVPLPALPFLAGSFVVAHRRAITLSRAEWISVAIFAGALALAGLLVGRLGL